MVPALSGALQIKKYHIFGICYVIFGICYVIFGICYIIFGRHDNSSYFKKSQNNADGRGAGKSRFGYRPHSEGLIKLLNVFIIFSLFFSGNKSNSL